MSNIDDLLKSKPDKTFKAETPGAYKRVVEGMKVGEQYQVMNPDGREVTMTVASRDEEYIAFTERAHRKPLYLLRG